MMSTTTQEKRAILFTNWLQKDWVGVYGGVKYPFKAGQSVMLEEHLAKHFAKHLAEWSFNSENIRYTPDKFEVAYQKALDTSVFVTGEDESKLEVEVAKKGVSEVNKGTSKEDLQELLDAKGIEYKGTWGVKRMQQALDESLLPEEEFEGLKQ